LESTFATKKMTINIVQIAKPFTPDSKIFEETQQSSISSMDNMRENIEEDPNPKN
jgi:hypothetical protein